MSSDSGSLVIDMITAGGKMDPPVVPDQVLVGEEGLVALAAPVLSRRAVHGLLVMSKGPRVTKVFATQSTQMSIKLPLHPLEFGVSVGQTAPVNPSVVVSELFLVHKTAHTESADQRSLGPFISLLGWVTQLHGDSEIHNEKVTN